MGVSMLTDERGEVRVETGTGKITELVEGGRNVKVVFKADHANLREPIGGWADGDNAELIERLRRCKAQSLRVEYRVEVHRKRNIDPNIPIKDVGSRDKVRDLVEVRALEAGEVPQTTQQPTRPVSAPSNGNGPTDAVTGSHCHLCGKPWGELPIKKNPDANGPKWVHAECPQAEAPGPEQPTESAAAQPAANGNPPKPAMRGRFGRGPRIEEAKPWEPLNSDGSINMGSYAYAACLGVVELSYELVMERNRTAAASNPGQVELEPPQWPHVKSLARTLLDIADGVQAALRSDHRPQRMDNSHKRARDAVKTALDVYPVPWGADDATREAWVAAITEHAANLLILAAEFTEGA